MQWWGLPETKERDALICDGSVRSGKTLSMAVGFVLWSMSGFDGQTFALCGKTIESLRRNVVMPLRGWLEGLFTVTERVAKNYVEITAAERTNRYYLFGGRDESSAALVQGITLAGVLFDEVALMPRSFVEQAMARCSVAGSRFWFNCNPEHPEHWFHKEWICKAKEHNALHLHFTMEDNLSLAPEIRTRYESLYAGVFYDRYIRGKWCVAEGLVYTMFERAFHVVQEKDRPYDRYYVSCDYGTVNPTSMGLWGRADGKWYRVREYYFDSRKEGRQRTDEEYYAELEKLAGEKRIKQVIVDPSAASFIECIKRHGRFNVWKADNDVITGIRKVADCLQNGLLFFNACCTASIAEFAVYRWDEKSLEDKPLKENDHAMDDIRYFVNTVVKTPPSRWGFSVKDYAK